MVYRHRFTFGNSETAVEFYKLCDSLGVDMHSIITKALRGRLFTNTYMLIELLDWTWRRYRPYHSLQSLLSTWNTTVPGWAHLLGLFDDRINAQQFFEWVDQSGVISREDMAIDSVDSFGFGPMHYASNTETIHTLIQRGAKFLDDCDWILEKAPLNSTSLTPMCATLTPYGLLKLIRGLAFRNEPFNFYDVISRDTFAHVAISAVIARQDDIIHRLMRWEDEPFDGCQFFLFNSTAHTPSPLLDVRQDGVALGVSIFPTEEEEDDKDEDSVLERMAFLIRCGYVHSLNQIASWEPIRLLPHNSLCSESGLLPVFSDLSTTVLDVWTAFLATVTPKYILRAEKLQGEIEKALLHKPATNQTSTPKITSFFKPLK